LINYNRTIFFLSFFTIDCEGEKSEKISAHKNIVGVGASGKINISAGVE
jgi:hypothetical protein